MDPPADSGSPSLPPSKRPRIFYGALDVAASSQLIKSEPTEAASDADKITLNVSSSGSIAPVSRPSSSVSSSLALSVPSLSSISQAEHSAHLSLISAIDQKYRFRSIRVPVEDNDVKRQLRLLGEPITLFGEGKGERRERLRKILSERPEEAEKLQEMEKENELEEKRAGDGDAKDWFESGPAALLDARRLITQFARERVIERMKLERATLQERAFNGDLLLRAQSQRVRELNSFVSSRSRIADDRPISGAAWDHSGSVLATSSWSGRSKLWKIPPVERSESSGAGGPSDVHLCTLVGHEFNIADLQFYSHPDRKPLLASCGIDYRICVYAPDLAQLEAQATSSAAAVSEAMRDSDSSPLISASAPEVSPIHQFDIPTFDRCSRVAFHPSGRYLFCSSFDKRFHMYDLEVGREVYSQPGHAQPTFGLACHSDGNLLAVGDLGAVGVAWDLRTGMPAWKFLGHAKKIVSVDFHSNGFLLASGSEDHTVKIWDLRRQRCLYTIPAHQHLVSSVRWCPDSNQRLFDSVSDNQPLREKFAALPTFNRALTNSFLLSASYDRTVRVWDGYSFQCRASFPQHTDKVTRAEWRPTGDSFVTTSFDRTFKLFMPQPVS